MKLLFMLSFIFNILVLANEPIQPIPQTMKVDRHKAALGKKLFFDRQLSADKTINCASCHILHDGGDDNLKSSFGIYGQKGPINSPTVYNAVFNFREFWDGRAADLQEQAAGPIENPKEMGFNFKDLVIRLNKTPYKKLFHSIYKEGITKETITDAIAEYEKSLITPNSPFDRYLRGEEEAITQNQKEGYALFKAKGCIACHHGINIGGNMYNKFGIFTDSNSTDLGRYNVTHKEQDKYYFKVPSLRNITETAPYFHDGRTYSLKTAIYLMAQYQLGRKITEEEVEKIMAFLNSLKGTLPKEIEP
jgi:cytochrome c peroxidase